MKKILNLEPKLKSDQKANKLIVVGLFSLLLFLSCKNSNKVDLPKFSGNANEVVIVIDNQLWNSIPGKLIRDLLSSAQYGLPQKEPKFDLVKISPSSFSSIFKIHRNLLLVDISSKHKVSSISFKNSVWSRGQLVIQLLSPDVTSFDSLFKVNSLKILQLYLNKELGRIISTNKNLGNKPLVNSISSKYMIQLAVPKQFDLSISTSDFFLLHREQFIKDGGLQHQVSQGVFYTDYPYSDTSDFSINNLLKKRDSITSVFIEGPSKNSHMQVSHRFIEPKSYKILFRNYFAIEIRGLWRIEGDYLGGPFYELNILDEKKEKIHCIDCYVFAPHFNKRDYLREVEAIVKSFDFTKK